MVLVNVKSNYRVQVFHPTKWVWKSFQCEAVSEKQALKLAADSNPGWLVRYARKAVVE